MQLMATGICSWPDDLNDRVQVWILALHIIEMDYAGAWVLYVNRELVCVCHPVMYRTTPIDHHTW